MNVITKILASVLATAALSSPVSAGSFNDSKQLATLVESTGTLVSFNTNSFDKTCPGKAGYYQYIKDVSDVLVVCTDQVNTDDPDELWETLAHESTHVAQACLGSMLFQESYHPRIFRSLATKAPHYAKMIDNQYSGDHAIAEAEAFWMELQAPSTVLAIFRKACTKS